MKLHEIRSLWLIKDEWSGWQILETLNTKLENLIWSIEANSIIGIGFIDSFEIKVKLDPITYKEFSGINLTFSVKYGNDFDEVFKNLNIKDASKIFGGVVNAIKEKITDFDWDFLCIVAKDHIEKRMTLYKAISDRLMRTLKLSIVHGHLNNDGIIILGKQSRKFNLNLVWNDFKSQIESNT